MKDKFNSKEMTQSDWAELRALSDKKPKRRPFIDTQKLKEINGTSGAYEKWVEKQGTSVPKGRLGDRFDFVTEDVRANPDSLTEDDEMYTNNQLTPAQETLGEAIEHLQGRQKQVYLLTMRQGLSIRDAAKRLKISKGTAQVYRTRAIAFLVTYCKQRAI